MARARLIRPEFFKHGELYDAERASGLPLRLAFAGLWTLADRAGRFAWKPREIKLDVLPYDDCDMADVLVALERHGFIVSYVVDGKRYGYVPSFHRHQTFHKTERASTLPPPPDNGSATVAAPFVNGEAPVNDTAVTGTGTGTGTDRKPPAADAAAARRVRPSPKPRSEAKYPHYPKAVCDVLHKIWEERRGSCEYGRFRKATAPLFPSASPPYDGDELAAALRLCLAVTKHKATVGRDGYEWRMLTPEAWVGRIVEWVEHHRRIQADPSHYDTLLPAAKAGAA